MRDPFSRSIITLFSNTPFPILLTALLFSLHSSVCARVRVDRTVHPRPVCDGKMARKFTRQSPLLRMPRLPKPPPKRSIWHPVVCTTTTPAPPPPLSPPPPPPPPGVRP